MTKIVGPEPRLEEPTQKGFYIDNLGELWILNDDGWVPLVYRGDYCADGTVEEYPKEFAPFRKCAYLEYR